MTDGPFDKIIQEIDRLTTEPARHLSLQLDEYALSIVRAAMTSGQAASLTLKVVAKRKGDQVELTGSVTAKTPKPLASSVAMYADDVGELFHHNPNHVRGPLPGIDVRPPKRKPADPREVEIPVNAKRE